MSEKRGCLKNTGLGCLGLIVLGLVMLGGTAIMAWIKLDDQNIRDRALAPDIEQAAVRAPVDSTGMLPASPGKIILDLAQGEFHLEPGEPGLGVMVKANYDASVYELIDEGGTLPDGRWVYTVTFHRTVSAMHHLFRQLMGAGHDPTLHIYLPPDVPIELEVKIKQGGLESELGGLWLTDADLRVNQGGFVMSVSEPLREPIGRLSVRGRMGGLQAIQLGNASPRVLDLDFAMGGADMDLSGKWLNDCDVRLVAKMGGFDLELPAGVAVEGLSGEDVHLRLADPEVPLPVLRFTAETKMGGFDIRQND